MKLQWPCQSRGARSLRDRDKAYRFVRSRQAPMFSAVDMLVCVSVLPERASCAALAIAAVMGYATRDMPWYA